MNMIKKLRKDMRLSQSDFASILGVKQNTVSNWENGIRNVDIETAKKMASFFGCSLDYLLGDEGTKSGSAAQIPVLGYVRAGIPATACENIIGYEEISESMAKSGEFFALKAKGDSMEPHIREGYTLIIRRQSDVENGEVAIALVGGEEATVKKVIKHDNGISLVPFNTASYSPMFFTKDEISTLPVSIIGKVVEFRGRF